MYISRLGILVLTMSIMLILSTDPVLASTPDPPTHQYYFPAFPVDVLSTYGQANQTLLGTWCCVHVEPDRGNYGTGFAMGFREDGTIVRDNEEGTWEPLGEDWEGPRGNEMFRYDVFDVDLPSLHFGGYSDFDMTTDGVIRIREGQMKCLDPIYCEDPDDLACCQDWEPLVCYPEQDLLDACIIRHMHTAQ